jgi:hypothetical protein
MKTTLFKILAKTNKVLLPSLSKKRVDLGNAKKWQLALVGYRYWVTINALDS